MFERGDRLVALNAKYFIHICLLVKVYLHGFEASKILSSAAGHLAYMQHLSF